MSATMTAQLVTDALMMAIWRRGKPDAWDCQDFRVWAGIMGKKEIPYVPTQRAFDTE
jgi:transposase InsO family protein